MSWTKEIQKLRECKRLKKRAADIHSQCVSTCAGGLDKIQKAMVARSKRKIAYALLQKFKNAYLEWIEEKKHSDEIVPTEEDLKELKPMPFITMVFSVGSNNEKKYIAPNIQQRYGARGKC